jgi:hypothetical protein
MRYRWASACDGEKSTTRERTNGDGRRRVTRKEKASNTLADTHSAPRTMTRASPSSQSPLHLLTHPPLLSSRTPHANIARTSRAERRTRPCCAPRASSPETTRRVGGTVRRDDNIHARKKAMDGSRLALRLVSFTSRGAWAWGPAARGTARPLSLRKAENHRARPRVETTHGRDGEKKLDEKAGLVLAGGPSPC